MEYGSDTVTRRVITRMRAMRRFCGLSQAELARKLGVRREVVANMENGRRSMVTIEEVTKLCEVFDVSLLALTSPKPFTMNATVE